ncbi:tRNA-splicing endonuclease subunit Sen54 [Genypterus blacodes]|uniref:tRNA-splicing endonuclease subunit Sen54 n=1 Tax=Genypterus blacodes TaxID=154954 RepID=UPI003F75FDBE
MADQNKTHAEAPKFYSEILSPSELFAARSRSHKIPVRGQKDFFPDDSDEQKQRLQQAQSEHWSLVSEERVERLGNLVKAMWIPDEQMVELQSPAGKFWQTMGFSANGKQCLLPEEALYLMECGNLQVFHRKLPLSIQDGYERFLSSQTLSLQQYQVFGHLKRLGYVVNRFDPSAETSSYAKQLNLPQARDKAARHLKRKHSDSSSAATSSTYTEAQEGSTSERMEEGESEAKEKEQQAKDPTEHPAELPASPEGPAARYPAASSSHEGRGDGAWWAADALRDSGHKSDHLPVSGPPRWDFRSISFPDLGSRESQPLRLAAPDPSLLPGALAVGLCDVSSWRKRLNMWEVKMSSRERKREHDQYGLRQDVNADREVRRCRNWAEYRELRAKRQGKVKGRPPHLWNREVTPLHDPTQRISTAELLDKISVIKSTDLLEGADRLKSSDDWRICFNVYQPDTVSDFKKSNPGKPYSRMCVCSFDGPVPDLRDMKLLSFKSGDVPVVFAVVDIGDISFYTFKDFKLPSDVYP